MDATLIVTVIGWILVPFTTYLIARRMFNSDRILDICEDLLDETATNDQFKAKIFAIGALIGSGIASGTGLQTKGGKFKWQDLAAQIIGQYAQKYIGAAQQPQQEGANPFA